MTSEEGVKLKNEKPYSIEFTNEGVKLTVSPPKGKGGAADVGEIVDEIKRRQIKNYDFRVIEHAVSMMDKKPYTIAPAQEKELINASAVVSITSDKMKAYLHIYPPDGGSKLSYTNLEGILSSKGVVHGIKNDVLKEIEINPIYEDDILVAEGTDPEPGQNGWVNYYIDISKDKKPTILDDGRVDFKELNKIESVVKGQKLCCLVDPVLGKDGKNILGQEVKASPVKQARLPKGKNVAPTEGGTELVANIDGLAELIDEKVSVFATYEVPADVDNSTGNIKFSGNVLVRGSVLAGFKVEASGNIEVWGSVEGATLIAEGSIILKRGIQGMGKGVLVSGCDIISRYIENCSLVQARQNIKAEAIMHSTVKCGETVELLGRKGLLVGGVCQIGKKISAKVIGSYLNIFTVIEIGIDPTLRDLYKDLKEELTNAFNDLKKTDQVIALLKKLEESGSITEDKKELLSRTINTKVALDEKVIELKEQIEETEEKLQAVNDGIAKVQNIIYTGVKVSIGSAVMFVKQNIDACSLYKEGADVKIGTY